jgi:two-component system CheB/CheR fusion protein
MPNRPNNPSQDFLIVGIGASAGGLEALKDFFSACSPAPGAAFVVVVHLAPDFKSHMSEILSHSTPMPVLEAADDMKVRADHVYIIPSGKELTIKDGFLRLAERGPNSQTIDVFLSSLAEDQKKRAVGVILSGELADGSRGVRAIKAHGGAAFAQDSGSAQHPHMPEAAAATGAVNPVLSPQDIARRLCRPSAPEAGLKRATQETPRQDAALAGICAFLRAALDVDFSDYKKPTIMRRVRRRMEALNIVSMEDYASALKTVPGEAQLLSDELLVHVTSFFRDPLAFEMMKAKVYPELIGRRSPKIPIRLWIVGCSTGEEVYSHAINLLEYLKEKNGLSPIKIFGTDLDEGVLAKARKGFFSEKAAAQLSPERLARYFEPVKGGRRIVKTIRDICVFAKHDITKDAPFSNMDFISCRNLLIYLEPALQKRVLPLLHYALRPNGFLLLGSSETVADTPGQFNEVDNKARLYSKIASASDRAPEFTISSERVEWASLPERRGNPTGTEPAGPELQTEVGRILLNQYTPAGVLIDDAMNIVQTHGSTNLFLELPSGIVSTNLAKMAHADLSLAIRAAVQRAKTEDVAVKKQVRARLRAEELDVQLDVIPVKTPQERRRHYLVLFSPLPKAPAADAHAGRMQTQLEFQQLREELDSAKEYVHWVSREQESTAQEKRTAGDETASAAEELHSMNEELEAAKEELQASNEELTTVNEELARRNAELRTSHDELASLLGSARIPIIVLDKDMNIRHFTPAAEATFDLHRSDTGKLLTSLNLSVQLPDLKNTIAKVLRGQKETSLEVRDREGRWYALWIRPYLTREKNIEGATLSLIDFTEKKKDILTLQSSRDYAEAALDARKVKMVILDSSLRILRANKLFYKRFKLTASKARGRTLFSLGKKMWSARPLREKLSALAHDETPFTDYECEFDVPSRGTRTLSISGRIVTHSTPDVKDVKDVKSLLITIEDVTTRQQVAEAVARRKSDAHQRDFVANVSHELMTPITAIKGYAEALVAGAFDNPNKRLKFSHIIEKHADRLTQLVEDLLQLSSSEAGHKKTADRIPLAEQILKLLPDLTPSARKRGISIRVKVAADLKVSMSKSELHQILQNLIQNAVKYNRSKGRVAIAAHVVGKRIIVSVQDTGIGVPKEDLTRIFDRFHRAANARTKTDRGSGLGLPIVKSILVAHGCRIWAESQKGKGTTFFFTLPKA